LILVRCRTDDNGHGKGKDKAGLEWPRVFQKVKVPRFQDNGTGWWLGCQPNAPAAFTPVNTPGTHFC